MAPELEIGLLLKRWVHSYEEDDGGRQVFRRSDYPFRRARLARQAMALGKEGKAEVEFPGPGDSVSSSGRWSLDGRLLSVTTPDFSGVYEVDSLDEEVLVLKATQSERLNRKGR